MTLFVAKIEERLSDNTALGVVLGVSYGVASIVLGLVWGPLLTFCVGVVSFAAVLLCLTTANCSHMAKSFIWGAVLTLGVFLVLVVQTPGWIYGAIIPVKN
jgi:hypothetical protein